MNDDKTPNLNSAPKVFDVMRPGKAPASATSRPVIVGHKPQVQDDLVGGTTSKVHEHEHAPLLDTPKVNIQPPSTLMAAPEDELVKITPVQPQQAPAEVASAPETPAVSFTEPEPTPTPVAATPEPEAVSAPTPEAQLTVPIPASTPAPALTPAPQAPLFEDDSKNETSVPLSDQLIAEANKIPGNEHPLLKQEGVFVSHHGPKFGVWGVVLTIVLLVIFVAVAVNFLLDAEVISIDGIPHSNLL